MNIDDRLRVSGRTALVTGAGAGIGRATARLLAERGAQALILLDLDAARLSEAAEECTSGLSAKASFRARPCAPRSCPGRRTQR